MCRILSAHAQNQSGMNRLAGLGRGFVCFLRLLNCAMGYILSARAETIIREREIAHEWLDTTMNTPELLLPHESDPTLYHALRRIPAFGDRILRVIYNATQEPSVIVTVYFDRTMKGKL